MIEQTQSTQFSIAEFKSISNAYYLTISLDSLRLIIPQTQVYALEPVLDVSYKDDNIGYIQIDDVICPVYTLSEELTPLVTIPEQRRICVLLHTDITMESALQEDLYYLPANMFGLLCDQVVLDEWTDKIEIFPLPACMRTIATKLIGLMLKDNEILGITSAKELLSCCNVQLNTEQPT